MMLMELQQFIVADALTHWAWTAFDQLICYVSAHAWVNIKVCHLYMNGI